MAKKIYENMKWYLEKADESSERWNEANNHLSELSDLVYKMWQNDLISDKVKDECYKTIQEIGWNLMKMFHAANNQ